MTDPRTDAELAALLKQCEGKPGYSQRADAIRQEIARRAEQPA